MLASHAIGQSAGTWRLSRLGGLVHAMPATSAALGAGLLGLVAVPPGAGFALMWLLFQAILSAPRTGGLLFQLPLALIGAAVALSAGLATAAALRLVGIAVLGRPRTPQGAGAQESRSTSRTILLVLTGLSLLTGVLPGAVLWLLADPAIHALTGAPPYLRIGLRLLVPSAAAPSYLALPVLALLALATGAVALAQRRLRKEAKTAGLWADGMPPPTGLPFGDPVAQSAGEGFVPTLPPLPLAPLLPTVLAPPMVVLARFPRLAGLALPEHPLAERSLAERSLPEHPLAERARTEYRRTRLRRPPSPITGLWLVLGAFGLLLLALAVTG
jgi:hypothetical protein